MAIEITPKQKIKIPLWTIILGSICLILIIGLSVSYFYFEKNIKKMSQEIEEKEEALTMTPSEKVLEDELFLYKEKISDFGKLLAEHRSSLKIFEFLEEICLPAVSFSDFDFASEKKQVTVSGKTDSFITLEQQILVLKQESLLKNLDLSGISMAEGGGVNFSFLLTFDPQILK